jgi:hypothetical protein
LHVTSTRLPQALQKRAWSGFGDAQLGQFIWLCPISLLGFRKERAIQERQKKERLQRGKESLEAYRMGIFRLNPDIWRSRKLEARWLDLLGYKWMHSLKELPSASRVVKEKNSHWKWTTFQTQTEDLH